MIGHTPCISIVCISGAAFCVFFSSLNYSAAQAASAENVSEVGKQVPLSDAAKHSGVPPDADLRAHHNPIIPGVCPDDARSCALAVLVRNPGEY